MSPRSAAGVVEKAEAEAGGFLVTGIEEARLGEDDSSRLERIMPFAVILFARHMPDLESLLSLTAQLRERDADCLLAIDHEGGRVDRTPDPFTHFPAALNMARHGDPGAVKHAGACQGAELRAAGFDIDFGPVLDIHTNEANPIIGDRAFGSTPEEVSHFALPWLQGLSESGVTGCGKHFPGHGDTDLDSHLALPTISHNIDRLRSVELRPFARAIASGVPMLMTAHLLCRALDAELPASLSKAAVSGYLRDELGYNGVVIVDDLEMKAVADQYGAGEAAVMALLAGNDLAMVCNGGRAMDEAHEGIARAIADRRIDKGLLARSRSRLSRLRKRAIKGRKKTRPISAIGAEEHRLLAAQLA
ncbi:MAG: beta-N-acetylhexosaminidase [Deltaproteobacteria bacterium]|nr:beta-N-acetylhexosaminidase [Deltaproteobacteria bacterium]